MTAAEAKQLGFVNDIVKVDLLGIDADWPDIAGIPAITQLANTDERTVQNCMALLNKARDNDRLDA